jgi:hypothetical protein
MFDSKSMFDFKNKNILITGGSRGIGLATATAFAKAASPPAPLPLGEEVLFLFSYSPFSQRGEGDWG